MAKEWKGEYYETNRKSREVGWVQANKLPIGGVWSFSGATQQRSFTSTELFIGRVSSVTQTHKEVVVPKIIEYSVINRTQKGRLWAVSQF